MPTVKRSNSLSSIVPSEHEIELFFKIISLAERRALVIEMTSEYNRTRAHSFTEKLLSRLGLSSEAKANEKRLSAYIRISASISSAKQELATQYGKSPHDIKQQLAVWTERIGYQWSSPKAASESIQHWINMAQEEPIKLFGDFWIFKESCYSVSGLYTDEQFKLLIFEHFDKERRKFERLKQRFDSNEHHASRSRQRIPERVRIEVWRRDGGKCARCGSRENLEYDHIVPIAQGGSNTARNIELLCEKCNRSKGANVA